jgi:arylsulfatase A-like enzyme
MNLQFLLALLCLVPFRVASPPNILIFLVDDAGWSGVGFHNPTLETPAIDSLREGGILLNKHYVYKFCSPTRGSMLSGRYPFRLGSMRSNFIPWSRPDGLNLNFTLLPAHLKSMGYSTHQVGKWHLGYYRKEFLPVSRGFDDSFGYLTGAEDHFTSELGFAIKCKQVIDLFNSTMPAYGKNVDYTEIEFAGHAEGIIRARGAALALAQQAAQQGGHGQQQHQQHQQDNATAPPPFFIYYALHATHGPVEAPKRYIKHNASNPAELNTFNGMISVVNDAMNNLTIALVETNQWNNTLVLYTHDNGAPLGAGGSNFPLRGGKNSNFEGGPRVPAILGGGWVPLIHRGTTREGLVHVSDWTPTLLQAAKMGVDVFSSTTSSSTTTTSSAATQIIRLMKRAELPATSAPIPIDGMSQLDYLLGPPDSYDATTGIRTASAACPRTEIVVDHCMKGHGDTSTGCNHFQVDGDVGAIIQGRWKLVKGPNGGEWSSWSNTTKCSAFARANACGSSSPKGPFNDTAGCLFDLISDPSEKVDLTLHGNATHMTIFNRLLARFEALKGEYHSAPTSANPPEEDDEVCHLAESTGGFLRPWHGVPTPPPPAPTPPPPTPTPPAPLPVCKGKAGDPGWEVMNHTGGGGPGYVQYPADGLTDTDLDKCRTHCCSSAHCVSCVLHKISSKKYGCWLNNVSGTVAPHSRAGTILAYVNRTELI